MAIKHYQALLEVDTEQLEDYSPESGYDKDNTIGRVGSEMSILTNCGIRLISHKEVKVDYNEAMQTPWDFVEKYYPDYHHADAIAWEGDLDKLVNGEYEDGDCAHQLLIEEYNSDINNPQIKADHDAAIRDIYETAILAYIATLKG